MSKTCSVEGCENKHFGKGYCCKHYTQFRRYGHILERTIYDKNKVIEYEDYAEMVLYDKDGNEVARTLIDLEYIDLVTKYKWYLSDNGYVKSKKMGRLHRFIMNPPEGMVVDHINHNPLDNRRDNLRICTQHENCFNQSMRKNNTSGTTGIYLDKRSNTWHAQIRVGDRRIYIGYFKTKEEAAEARRQAEIEYFGEFAPTKE